MLIIFKILRKHPDALALYRVSFGIDPAVPIIDNEVSRLQITKVFYND